MIIRQIKHILGALYSLYADSGFAMAGAVAYSFVLSLFPFCIFVGAVAGHFGGEAFVLPECTTSGTLGFRRHSRCPLV